MAANLPLPVVVIVGGGFGGIRCAQRLRSAPVQVVVLDWNSYHLFQPLLYQVATGALSPGNIATPIRQVLRRQANCQVQLAKAVDVDPVSREVILEDARLPYDSLVVASGARHGYFGHPQWEAVAPGLKSVDDALEVRRRIFLAFERAEREKDPLRRRELLTFVVIGGGPTGVELAGAVAEIAMKGMQGEFRNIAPERARMVLIEAGPRILSSFTEASSQHSLADLTALGVEVITRARVTDITAETVSYEIDHVATTIRTTTVLWGAGVQGTPLAQALARTLHVPLDRSGRLQVEADCSLPGHGHIFAIGDAAAYAPGGDGHPLPGVAQVAMQQGDFVARLIRARLEHRPLPTFSYRDLGSLATIGKRRAVAEIGKLRLTGTLAWLAWVFVHIAQLITVQNRLIVLVHWAWYWATWRRSIRIISHPAAASAVADQGSGGGPVP